MADTTYKRKEYVQSDAVKQAQAALQQQQAQKPGAYTSPWQQTLNDTISKIQNREKFSYDLNGDALYQQYKNRYIQQGQQAMMDTMGQAAAMTGGYGNSYAQSVGQQTYQGYLQGLNDKIPELYNLALSKYQTEGNDLMNQYGLLAERENTDYSRYRDQMGDYNDQLNYLQNQYNNALSFDYGMYRDAEADAQWQAEFDEAKRRYDQEWEAANTEASGGSGGSGNGAGDGDGEDEGEFDWKSEAINTLLADFPNKIVTDTEAWNAAANMAGGAAALRDAGFVLRVNSPKGQGKAAGNKYNSFN